MQPMVETASCLHFGVWGEIILSEKAAVADWARRGLLLWMLGEVIQFRDFGGFRAFLDPLEPFRCRNCFAGSFSGVFWDSAAASFPGLTPPSSGNVGRSEKHEVSIISKLVKGNADNSSHCCAKNSPGSSNWSKLSSLQSVLSSALWTSDKSLIDVIAEIPSVSIRSELEGWSNCDLEVVMAWSLLLVWSSLSDLALVTWTRCVTYLELMYKNVSSCYL